ncbi:hypothetical protein LTS18_003739, partial [Coniosporium uncinatum]
IYPFNAGFNYKNTISNGGFFQLAARLARYTGNATYAGWADKMYDWMEETGLVDEQYMVYDGADVADNCTVKNKIQYTYNYGTMIAGAAYMYNHTNGSATWHHRLSGLLNMTFTHFFPHDIMDEVALHHCSRTQICKADQPSFKAYLARWLAASWQLAPFTRKAIMRRLEKSAQAAARGCVGPGDACGRFWNRGLVGEAAWDGMVGLGEQMSALAVIQGTLVERVEPPVTVGRGLSASDPDGGYGSAEKDERVALRPVVAGDRVSAWLVTAMMLMLVLGGAVVMVSGVWEDEMVGKGVQVGRRASVESYDSMAVLKYYTGD